MKAKRNVPVPQVEKRFSPLSRVFTEFLWMWFLFFRVIELIFLASYWVLPSFYQGTILMLFKEAYWVFTEF